MVKMKFNAKYYDFLDNLRDSGVTNMLGAAPYLVREFPELYIPKARQILTDWIKTFGERHPKKESGYNKKGGEVNG